MSNPNSNTKEAETPPRVVVRISAENCLPALKEAFERWWRANGFASESEAIRDYVRKVTGFKEECQVNSPD